MSSTGTCVVLLLGYPGVGKRTVGTEVARLLDGVLVDNQLINIPILTLFKWDGKVQLPPGALRRTGPIRDAVLETIEELAPQSISYVFTNVLEDTPEGAASYERMRTLARRRCSKFLCVVLTCAIDQQVRRIDTPDRVARLKGSDPERYRHYTLTTRLFVPSPEDLLVLDTTHALPADVAGTIVDKLKSAVP